MSRYRELRQIRQLVFGQPHLIEPSAGELIGQVVLRAQSMSAEELHAEAQARLGPDRGIQRRDPAHYPNGVLIVPVKGELSQRHTNLAADSGIANYERLSRIAHAADADDSVKHIVLYIDSPGGLHSGLIECMAVWQNLDTPVTTYCDSLMASAAYGLGACANEVVISPGGVRVGSIGSIMLFPDLSGQLEQEGIKVQIFRSGALKAPTQFESLSEEQADAMQRRIDEAARGLMTAICGVRTQCTPEGLWDLQGDLFTRDEAIDHQLADRVELWEDFISDLVGLPYGDGSWDNMRDYEPSPFDPGPEEQPEEDSMNARAIAVAMGLAEADIAAHEEAGDLDSWVAEQAKSQAEDRAALRLELNQAQDREEQAHKVRVDALVERAISERKIRKNDTEAQDSLRELADLNFERAEASVNGMAAWLPGPDDTEMPDLPDNPAQPATTIRSLEDIPAPEIGPMESRVIEEFSLSQDGFIAAARRNEIRIRSVEYEGQHGRKPTWDNLQDLPIKSEAQVYDEMFKQNPLG